MGHTKKGWLGGYPGRMQSTGETFHCEEIIAVFVDESQQLLTVKQWIFVELFQEHVLKKKNDFMHCSP